MSEPSLREIQHWLAARVRGMRPTQPRPAVRGRIGIYVDAYRARSEEVLGEDFRGLARALGDQAFARLVRGYLRRHPSRHPNLNRLGHALPGYVARALRGPRRGFLADLARAEWAACEAFDAPEFTSLGPDDLATVPPDAWAATRLVLNPSVRLLRLRHPVGDWLERARAGETPPDPAPASEHLVVHRVGGSVRRMAVPAPIARLLRALSRGSPLGAALSRAGELPGLQDWFARIAHLVSGV